MGAIVGAALVSHVPTIVLPEAVRRELNDAPAIVHAQRERADVEPRVRRGRHDTAIRPAPGTQRPKPP